MIPPVWRFWLGVVALLLGLVSLGWAGVAILLGAVVACQAVRQEVEADRLKVRIKGTDG